MDRQRRGNDRLFLDVLYGGGYRRRGARGDARQLEKLHREVIPVLLFSQLAQVLFDIVEFLPLLKPVDLLLARKVAGLLIAARAGGLFFELLDALLGLQAL